METNLCRMFWYFEASLDNDTIVTLRQTKWVAGFILVVMVLLI